MRRLLALLPLALVALACGQRGVVQPFMPEPTAKCLRGQGFDVSTSDKNVELVISTASNGGLRATKSGVENVLEIAFTANAREAKQELEAIRRVAPKSLRLHLADVTTIKRNAVLLWTVSPGPELQQTALTCLSS